MPIYLLLVLILCAVPLAMAAEGGFPAFDRRAQAGERLNVVFFGASLTWGANASDQDLTSYRAVVRERFAKRYPQAHISCFDAAIGGTGSTLGAFRLEHDVLSHHPDLVFVDFTANDGIYADDAESLSSYESILRRLAAAGIPVVQVAFPFRWDVERAKFPTMKRLHAHQALATTYGNGWGDAVDRITTGLEQKTYSLTDIWVADGAHPYDLGYSEFAAAAWDGFETAVRNGAVPHVPAEWVHPATYGHLQRYTLTSLPTLPTGWRQTRPNRTAINHDWLMSRWLDQLVVVRNRALGPDGKPLAPAVPVEPLRLSIQASTIILFGEATATSGHFRVKLDGTVITGLWCQAKDTDFFEANRWKTGNGHLVIELARNLDATRTHLVEIEPLFDAAQDQELRIESICVAGGPATVALAPATP